MTIYGVYGLNMSAQLLSNCISGILDAVSEKEQFKIVLSLYIRNGHNKGREKLSTRRHVRPMPSFSQLITGSGWHKVHE